MNRSIFEYLKQQIVSHLGYLSPTPSGFSKRNCMMCASRGHRPDKRKRFGIKFEGDSIAMNCFNCGFSAGWDPTKQLSKNFVDFLNEIGIPGHEIKRIQFEVFKEQKNHDTHTVFEVKEKVTSKWKQKDLPNGSHEFRYWIDQRCNDSCFLRCLEYSINRGFYDPDKLFWTPEKKKQLNRRIIFPFYYQGKTVGYTARFYKDMADKSVPKYINDMPTSYLYNLDEQSHENKYLIVCEGVVDAMVTKGISPLGSINQEQIELINQMDKIVIVSPDRDKTGNDLIDVAINQRWCVSFPPWKKYIKDAAKASEMYGRIATVQSILENTESNKFNIKLKRKMDRTG